VDCAGQASGGRAGAFGGFLIQFRLCVVIKLGGSGVLGHELRYRLGVVLSMTGYNGEYHNESFGSKFRSKLRRIIRCIRLSWRNGFEA
jgi:hypothetical protein